MNSNLFGLPFDADECDIPVLHAPWDLTVSYGAGTVDCPREVKPASAQVDMNGFDPSLCSNTGTPVPDGLSMAQFTYLLDAVVASGRKIIGGDLVEVAPGKGQWDANVGARVLFAISHRLA
ncbi:MAG: arginase family protein [Schleiferiaceae bacterium]|nr:arginase family protein [Schleiferiaceae bacterium]